MWTRVCNHSIDMIDARNEHGWIQYAPFLHHRVCRGHLHPDVRALCCSCFHRKYCLWRTSGLRHPPSIHSFNVVRGRGRQRPSRSADYSLHIYTPKQSHFHLKSLHTSFPFFIIIIYFHFSFSSIFFHFRSFVLSFSFIFCHVLSFSFIFSFLFFFFFVFFFFFFFLYFSFSSSLFFHLFLFLFFLLFFFFFFFFLFFFFFFFSFFFLLLLLCLCLCLCQFFFFCGTLPSRRV